MNPYRIIYLDDAGNRRETEVYSLTYGMAWMQCIGMAFLGNGGESHMAVVCIEIEDLTDHSTVFHLDYFKVEEVFCYGR